MDGLFFSIIFVLLCSAAACIDGKLYSITVNTTNVAVEVEPSFLSIALDSNMIAKDLKPLKFSSKKFLALCEGLSKVNVNRPEIYLRIGGSKGDDVVFQKTGQDINSEKYILNSTEWDSINNFAMKFQWKLIFGLNSLLRRYDGSWDPSNAIELMRYTASKGYLVNYELGNEPDLYLGHRNISIAPAQLARDFGTLKVLVQEESSGAPLIFGPDTATKHRKDYLPRFLSYIEDGILDAVTFHYYYGASVNASVHNFTDPRYLDKFLAYTIEIKEIIKSQPATINTPLWIGETASTYGGGAPGLSDGFAAGFLWLDKLGLAARLNISVVIRQTLLGGNYGLLDKDLNPTPDYWISVLYKQLVGNRVLDVNNSLAYNRTVRVYAHCVNVFGDSHYDRGAVTVLAINLNATDDAFVNLTGPLSDLDADQYLLQPSDDDVTSKKVMLNGNLLELVDDVKLPSIKPVPVKQPFYLPPLTYGFFVVKNAKAIACI